jgi:hypothetical protein
MGARLAESEFLRAARIGPDRQYIPYEVEPTCAVSELAE